jgi:hypothetical protein
MSFGGGACRFAVAADLKQYHKHSGSVPWVEHIAEMEGTILPIEMAHSTVWRASECGDDQ